MAKLRIIIADDNPAFLRRVVSLLSADFDIVATAAEGKSALEAVRRCECDLVVLDLGLPGLNGIDVTREIVKPPGSDPPVVICSVETDPEIVEAARRAGALGYVFKTRLEKDLIEAVNSAIQGKPFVSPPLR